MYYKAELARGYTNLPKLWRPALAKSKRLHQRSPIVSIPEPLGNACPMFTSLQKWYHNGIILFRDIALNHLRCRPIDNVGSYHSLVIAIITVKAGQFTPRHRRRGITRLVEKETFRDALHKNI